MDSDRDYRIAAVDRALAVLEHLARRPDQGVTDIAQALGMTKSIVFRILATLEARGFVAKDPARAVYALGYRMAVLGERAGRREGLILAAEDEMDRLNEATSENINLIVRDGTRALVVATREGRHSMRLFAAAGRHGPLHAGGGSLLLLAFAPREVREAVLSAPLQAYTDRTETDAATLAETLERIRAQGWNVARDDLDEGAFSIAAPIRGADGDVTAAISVAGAVARLSEARRASHLSAVLAAAQRISTRLGLTPLAETG
ncbi:MAG: IclR family transcriptional regulator [Pseudomonadota bacterium]